MGPNVTFIMAFFILFTCVSLCQFCTITPLVLFTNNNKVWNLRKNFFVSLAASVHDVISKEVEKCIFRHTCMYKLPILVMQWMSYWVSCFYWIFFASGAPSLPLNDQLTLFWVVFWDSIFFSFFMLGGKGGGTCFIEKMYSNKTF